MTGLVRLTVRHEQVAKRRGVATHQLADLDPEAPLHDEWQSRDEPVASERHSTAGRVPLPSIFSQRLSHACNMNGLGRLIARTRSSHPFASSRSNA